MTKITRADRDAAWPYADFHCLPDIQMRERWFAGYYDNLEQGHAIQAFARHRLEERAKIVAWLRKEAIMSTDTVRRRMNKALDQVEAGDHLK